MSLSSLEIENILDKTITTLQEFYSGPIHRPELLEDLQSAELDNSSKVQKKIFFTFAKKLRDSHKLHWKYDLNKVPEGTVWEPMKKLVTAVRVNELKEVKVIRKKGKYDVNQLRMTYFGKMLLEDIPELGKRWSLSEDEFQKVSIKCRKLGLNLPEVIAPTTTEVFFGDE